MKHIYSILTFPGWIAYNYYSRRDQLLEEDFMAMCQHHKLLGISRHSAFVYLMQQFPEYRYLFYYRLPFWIRHLLNIVLRRRDMRISCVCVGGGNN